MRIGIIGAGAVGGEFGGKLARAGKDVWLVARGRTLEVLRETGLTLIDAEGARSVIDVPAASSSRNSAGWT